MDSFTIRMGYYHHVECRSWVDNASVPYLGEKGSNFGPITSYPQFSVSPANHSTNFSNIINHPGLAQYRPISSRSAEWTHLDSTPHYTNLILFN
jgi:hypothetical protein